MGGRKICLLVELREEWCGKVEKICEELDVPVLVCCSIENNIYRKPIVGWWEYIVDNVGGKLGKKSFYVGDAAGRKGDHADSDYKFALNWDVAFYTPEEFFLGKDSKEKSLRYPDLEGFEEKLCKFSSLKTPWVVLLVGVQGSGKSTFYEKYFSEDAVELSFDSVKGSNKKKGLEKIIGENEGENFVVANINNTEVRRREIIDMFDEGEYNFYVVEIECDKDVAWHNVMYRFYKTGRYLSKIVLNTYYSHYEDPGEDVFKYKKIFRCSLDYGEDADDDYFRYYY